MTRCCTYIIATALTSVAHGQLPQHNDVPPSGYVPDAATAIKIAVAVWEPIYGASKIASEKPYHATLNGDTWTVTASAPLMDRIFMRFSGNAIAQISKRDGRILRVSHTM